VSWLVVGLGNPDRGDDAVGPVIASGIAGLEIPGVDVVAQEDPTGLLDVWGAYPAVVVVDAILTGARPGTVLTMEAGAGAGVLADQAWARTGRGGTHAFGIAAAIELGRALGRLPHRVVLVGVEVARVEHGPGLSREVAGVLDRVQDVVVAVLRENPWPEAATRPRTADASAPASPRAVEA